MASSLPFNFFVAPLTIFVSLPVPSSKEYFHQKYKNSPAIKVLFLQSAFCLMLSHDRFARLAWKG